MQMRRWLKRCGLALLAVCGLIAALEIEVRLFAPQPTGLSHQDRFGLAMHYPGIVRHLPQYGTEVSINSAGMRDREHAIAKPSGTFRILLFGDSFMEALQVPFDSSFPRLLESELSTRIGQPVEVVNAGVSGWGTDDQLRYFTRYGQAYRPDLVLVAMTLHNDFSDNLREQWHTLQSDSLVERADVPIPFMTYKLLQLKAFIATRMQLYQLWRRVRHGQEIQQTVASLNQHIVELFREPPPERIVRGFQLTGLLLTALDSATQATGGRTVLMLLPLRVQLSDSGFASFVRQSGLPPGEMVPDRPQHVMDSIAVSRGLPVIDLLEPFKGWTEAGKASLFLPRDGHWNEIGHRMAAQVAADSLASNLGAR